MWTADDLKDLVRERLGDYLFIVVANRQPYVHTFNKGKIECRRSVGGVVSALDPVMQACQGLWVAHGNGDADKQRADAQGKLKVPPEDPRYVLKRIWMTKKEEEEFYYGYSNEALWPLSHTAFRRPVFEKGDWETYQKINERFARAVIEEIGDKKAFVWIQDYHLCLLPKYLKELAPKQLIIAHFWHIPWANYEIFRICPQGKEILEGLLANDLLGFHTRYHCNNFLDVIDREVECKIDREKQAVVRGDHQTLIRPYPISADFEGINRMVDEPQRGTLQESFISEYNLQDQKIILGVDRIDYTKGIPEKILAIDMLLDNHPELKGKVMFWQIGVVTRLHIAEYKKLNDEINALVEQVNWKHATDGWKPVVLVRRQFFLKELVAIYNLADVMVVGALHDGMNLVAKEYVAARKDEKGALVLSQFTGAARELTEAVLINPYDREQFSEGLWTALNFTEEERGKRMRKMREVLKVNNIFRWSGKIISELLSFEFKE
ncbi:MAG TPA: trehalose-6-phosphate synthase [Candidatus Omnitrophica bacterium]|nr:trehalose-6-phosphate synthase [Candidatus Omnitrophota bacterium]